MIELNKIYNEDAIQTMSRMEDNSIDCVVTSPPYWGLRSYDIPPQIWPDSQPLCEEHEWQIKDYKNPMDRDGQYGDSFQPQGHGKNITEAPVISQFCLHCNAWRGELGLEPTPELYVEHITQIFREVKRVLSKTGTLFLNLGDSYAGSCADIVSSGSAYPNLTNPSQNIKLKPKDLCGMPWRVAFALQSDGWWLRRDIIWSKPNPMPESCTDRPTTSHEYIFLLTKAANYFYDAEAIREPLICPNETRRPVGSKGAWEMDGREQGDNGGGSPYEGYPSKRNKRSVWTMATQPFPEKHFATFPLKLPSICIKAGTSEKGKCSECGSPWERLIEPDEERKKQLGKGFHDHSNDRDQGWSQAKQMPQPQGGYVTLGWQSTCECNAEIVPCVVYDPFMGAGTVALASEKYSRDWIGSELSVDYCKMAQKRVDVERGQLKLAI